MREKKITIQNVNTTDNKNYIDISINNQYPRTGMHILKRTLNSFSSVINIGTNHWQKDTLSQKCSDRQPSVLFIAELFQLH